MRSTTSYPESLTSRRVMLSEGWRLLSRGIRRKLKGHRRYSGTAEQICEQIVGECFDTRERFFRTSVSSYPEFWARDFGRCVPALLELGFENEVGDSYRYALSRYAKAGQFALALTPGGKPFDFPAYAPDGFAFFVDGLARLGDRALVARYRSFLEQQTRRFFALVIDPANGLVRRGKRFSEAQDYAVRDSSCYSNCVCFLVQRALDALELPNPLASFDYRTLVFDHFWAEDHFVDDQTRPSYPSGDAQLAPFFTGLVGSDAAAVERFVRVLSWMDGQGLNHPLPTRYGVAQPPERRMSKLHRLHPWQRDTVWTCLGLHLLETLYELKQARFATELERYRRLVERLGCFPELLDPVTEQLYASPLVMGEEAMLWAANLWCLLRRRDGAGDATLPRRSVSA